MPSANLPSYVPPQVYAEFRGEHKKDMTAALYNIDVPKSNKLFTSEQKTIPELLSVAVEKFGSRNAVGHRKLIKREFFPCNPSEPDGRQFEKLTLAPEYTWTTYKDYAARIQSLAQGLAVFYAFKPRDSIAIYAETQEDWMTMAHAAWSMNLKVTTIYATLGPDAAAFGIRQAKCPVVVCDHAMMKTMGKILDKAKCVKGVIVMGAKHMDVEGVRTERLDTLIKNGAQVEKKAEFEAPKGEDIAVIMFTSGTTGNPKGVKISHGALATQATGSVKVFPQMDENSIHIAYLPLAHIMEVVIELGIIAIGACAAYSSPHTLTDTGAKIAEGVSGDAVVAKPTVILFAPAVLDKVYNKIRARFAAQTGAKKIVIKKSLASGLKNQANHKIGASKLWYTIGFDKTLQVVGGNVQLMLCGSAPLSSAVQQFCQTALRAPLRQGYGLTETLASSCILHSSDNSTNTVGPPTTCTTIRLRDWAEGGYLVADKDNEEIGLPRGEILIGGNALSEGYLVNDDDEDVDKIRQKNKEEYIVVDGERFFCTGDIGQITKQGTLMVIDRKKDLFKGSTGEYVALSKVESLMKISKYVEIPFVYGRTGEETVIALVSPMVDEILELAESLGMETKGADMNQLIENQDINSAVWADINKVLKPLKRFERPSALRLVLAEGGLPAFSPENDMVTAASKIKRPVVARVYEKVITDAYRAPKNAAPAGGPMAEVANGDGKQSKKDKKHASMKKEKKKSVKKAKKEEKSKKEEAKKQDQEDKAKKEDKTKTEEAKKQDQEDKAKKEEVKKEDKTKTEEAKKEDKAKTEEVKKEHKTKTEKANTEDVKTEEVKKEEVKTEDVKTDHKTKTEEAKKEDMTKTEETKKEDKTMKEEVKKEHKTKTEKANTEDVKTEEVKKEHKAKTEKANTEDVKTEEVKTEDVKKEHKTKTEEAKKEEVEADVTSQEDDAPAPVGEAAEEG